MHPSEINIDLVLPEVKDIERVEGFAYDTSFGRCTWYGNNSPSATGAKRMAKAIKDPFKLIRRAKAVVLRWGTEPHTGYSGGQPIKEDVWAPFENQLTALGFNRSQIYKIKNYR